MMTSRRGSTKHQDVGGPHPPRRSVYHEIRENVGKARPVCAKLKLHGNAGDDTHGKIEAENLGPKPYGVILLFITRPQGTPFPIHEVVIGHREAELHPAPKRRIIEIRVHGHLLRSRRVFEARLTTATAAFTHD